MVQINLKKAGPATLQLFDFAGKLVQTIPTEVLAATGNYAGEINLPNLTPGMYFLRLQHVEGIQTTKLVKVE